MPVEEKKAIRENDVVLVYVQNEPAFFARVEKIMPDYKKGWWQITFLMLKIPLEVFSWILDEHQIRGADFTMNGMPLRLEHVIAPAQQFKRPPKPKNKNVTQPAHPKKQEDAPKRTASILSLQRKQNSSEPNSQA